MTTALAAAAVALSCGMPLAEAAAALGEIEPGEAARRGQTLA